MTDSVSPDPSRLEQAIGTALSTRLHQLRTTRGLSLDALARLSGLSKGTVVGLEQGKANPSIGVLCRLAVALGVSVPDLVAPHPAPATEAPLEATAPTVLWSTPAGSLARLEAGTPGSPLFELWTWMMMPGDRHASDGHSPGTAELLTVTAGCLRVEVADSTQLLRAGDSARLRTDRPHAYATDGDAPVHFMMAVLEPGG